MPPVTTLFGKPLELDLLGEPLLAAGRGSASWSD
jgi:hypothetical protein